MNLFRCPRKTIGSKSRLDQQDHHAFSFNLSHPSRCSCLSKQIQEVPIVRILTNMAVHLNEGVYAIRTPFVKQPTQTLTRAKMPKNSVPRHLSLVSI